MPDVTVDTTKQPSDWAKGKGATVGMRNVTSDALKPTYVVFHFVSVL